MTRYFVISKEHAEPIQADCEAVYERNKARLTEMVGAEIEGFRRWGNLAAGFANITGVMLKDKAAPHSPDWQPDKDDPDVLVPNKRRKAGKVAVEELEGMDALHIMSALKRAGVSPWIRDERNPFSGGHVGLAEANGALLLTARDDWKLPNWPEWVREVKGSEYHALLEAAEQVPA